MTRLGKRGLEAYTRAMIMLELKPATEARLARLAAQTGRTPVELAGAAVDEFLEDREDYEMAAEAAANPGRIFTSEDAKRELGL